MKVSALSDEQIVSRVLEGETPLFELLMRRYNPMLYRAVRSILRDEAEVEDAMQQAYLLAYTRLGQFRGASRFSTWLVRIGIHEALGRVRWAKRTVPVEVTPEPEGEETVSTPEDEVTRAELAALLEGAVDALPETYRSTFVLREIQGLSSPEVAEVLGTTEEVVRTRVRRARLILEDHLRGATRSQLDASYLFHAPRCDRVVSGVLAQIAAVRSLRRPRSAHR